MNNETPAAASSHHADRALVDRMVAGDERAFETFSDEYIPALFRFALYRLNRDRDLAEDIVQTTLVKVMERRSDESPMVGDVSQYNLQFYVQHDSLSGAGFPVPPIKGDRIHDANSRIYTIRSVEEMHDQSGNVGGYRMWARGH